MLPMIRQLVKLFQLEIFVFSTTAWKIGRVLSFAYYLEKYKSAQAYNKTTFKFADSSKKAVGVLCTWYTPSQSPEKLFWLIKALFINMFLLIAMYAL